MLEAGPWIGTHPPPVIASNWPKSGFLWGHSLIFFKKRLFRPHSLIFLRFRPFFAEIRDKSFVLGLVGFLFLYFVFLCKFCAIFRNFLFFSSELFSIGMICNVAYHLRGIKANLLGEFFPGGPEWDRYCTYFGMI